VQGRAFYDDNGNGAQDPGEAPAAGATITITCVTCPGTPPVGAGTADSGGTYHVTVPTPLGPQQYALVATANRSGGPSVASGPNYGGSTRFVLDPGATATQDVGLAPHDSRYFAQTGYRIDRDTIWDYYNRRGGLATFGYPTSRTFILQGFTVQFFQRRVVQLDPQGHARLLNLLDPGLLPYTSFNGSTFPGVDAALVASAPDPTNQPAVLAWVQQHAPDAVAGAPVNFDATFRNSVSAQVAFPNGGDASLLPGIDLELWGVPTSQPLMDPTNHNFIYLRWQRGIMHYDATCTCTQGILLADYFKAILTGQHLPSDVAQEATDSPFLDQYDLTQPHWVHNPSLLPNTDMTNAFEPE
jgi:hypothetical protein